MVGTSRYKRAYDLRQEGKTYREIGADLGVSWTRARGMAERYRRCTVDGVPLSAAEHRYWECLKIRDEIWGK
jgi:hypothetical protein